MKTNNVRSVLSLPRGLFVSRASPSASRPSTQRCGGSAGAPQSAVGYLELATACSALSSEKRRSISKIGDLPRWTRMRYAVCDARSWWRSAREQFYKDSKPTALQRNRFAAYGVSRAHSLGDARASARRVAWAGPWPQFHRQSRGAEPSANLRGRRSVGEVDRSSLLDQQGHPFHRHRRAEFRWASWAAVHR